MDTDLRCQLSTRLDREWARLTRRRAVVDMVRSWQVTDRPFRSLDELLALAGFRTDVGAEGDVVLSRLVAVAAHDPLAGRIVLQRILPGLLATTKIEQARTGRTDVFEELVGDAWIAIGRYRVDARPTHVAARLLNDVRQRAIVSSRRRRVVSEEVTDVTAFAELIDPRRPAAFDELVGVVVEARRRGLADRHVATVGDALRHDTARQTAAAGKCTDRMVRYREHRAAAAIRRLATAA